MSDLNQAFSGRRLVARHRQEPDAWPTTPAEEDSHEQRMLHWFGLRPRTSWHLRHYPCPRTIVGKRCLNHRERGECICQKHHHILDHSRGWVDQAGEFVHTAEPYSFTGQEMAELVADLTDIDVRVDVSGESLWFPSSTVMLVLRRAPRPQPHQFDNQENP